MFKFKKKEPKNVQTNLQKVHEQNDIVFQSDNVFLYKYIINKTTVINFENWKKNRPPDEVRIRQISEYFKGNNLRIIPGVIYAWKTPQEANLVVYDGIHRLLAAKESEKELICLIQVTATNDEQVIVDHFLNINKSVSVPSIYLEETDVLKKLVCQNVANELCRRYPTFVSPSRKPFIYNFNRDNIVEFISTLELDFCKPGIDKKIVNELNGMNYLAKDHVIRNQISHPKKCSFHNFYLFYLDKPVIKHRLEEVLS
jgi:hypothetical protein